MFGLVREKSLINTQAKVLELKTSINNIMEDRVRLNDMVCENEDHISEIMEQVAHLKKINVRWHDQLVVARLKAESSRIEIREQVAFLKRKIKRAPRMISVEDKMSLPRFGVDVIVYQKNGNKFVAYRIKGHSSKWHWEDSWGDEYAPGCITHIMYIPKAKKRLR